MSEFAVTDASLKVAVSTLLTEPNRRLLGTILGEVKSPQDLTPIKTTFPLALKAMLQNVDSQGQGGKAYESLRANQPTIFEQLASADLKNVTRIASAVVQEHPFADQPHREVIAAAFRRGGHQTTAPKVVLPVRPHYMATTFRVPGLVGSV